MPPKPVAKLVLLTPLPIHVGQPIEVDASGTTGVGPPQKWRWNVQWPPNTTLTYTGFPGKSTHPGYEQSGTYTVLLGVTDPKGGVDEDAITIDVQAVAPPPEPVDCVLGEEVIVSETPLEACQPDGYQAVDVAWMKPVLVEPAHGGAPCGLRSGVRREKHACEYVPPPPVGDLVPVECRTTWAPGVQGIPARETIFTTINASEYADGAEEASAAIQAAIDVSPLGQAILLSGGTFRCNDGYPILRRAVTLRGAGQGKTFLVKTNGAQEGTHVPIDANPVVLIGPHRWPTVDSTTSVNLASDGVKGSHSIAVVDTFLFVPGQIVFLDRDDYNTASWLQCPPRSNGAQSKFWGTDLIAFAKHDPPDQADDPFPASLSWFSRPGRPLCEIKEIAGVDGEAGTITFTTPLHADYRVSKFAQVTRFDSVHVQGAGLEDMTVLGGGDGNVIFNAAAHCWVKNVESTDWTGRGVRAIQSFRCSIRDSYLHDGGRPYPGAAGYNMSLTSGSSEILVENNISIGTNKNMTVESAGAGSVVAYNYMDNAQISYSPPWVEVGLNASHMVGGHHVLFEGNQAPNYDSDDTHGNAFAMTIFRNHLTGQRRDFTDVQNVRCAGLMFGSWWHAFIGNVLGEAGKMAGWTYDWVNEKCVYKLGYAPSHWEQAADPKVLSTVLRDGNFDYLTDTVKWDRVPQTLPDSLYLTVKPAFFGDLTWPWVDPFAPTKIHTLPARARYEAGV